jgi:hypothetical protein
MTRLHFTRARNGEFHEADLRLAAKHLRARRGGDSRVPLELKAHATAQLIAETWKIFEAQPHLHFHECAFRAVRKHPELAFFDRLDSLPPGERDLDVEIDDEEAA